MNYFVEMLKLQDSFNYKTAKNIVKNNGTYNGVEVVEEWKDNGFDWVNYIMIEASEQNSSLDFKHWKAGKDDLDNFKVEVIDNWHFLMSLGLERFSSSYLANTYEYLWYELLEEDDSVNLQNATQYFTYQVLKTKFEENFEEDYFHSVYVLFSIMQELGIYDEADLYKEYLVKNVLNEIRLLNGYKEGTYQKMWFFENEKVEDNVVAYSICSEDSTYDSLLSDLQTYYDNMPKGN